jgi:UDP-glucose 4-epimerase
MTKILITGGSGFIGSRLIKRLAPRTNIVVLTRSRDHTRHREAEKMTMFTTDYEVETLKPQLEGIDSVVHLAGKRIRAKNEESYIVNYLDNVAITASLFEACKLNRISNIVNISSIGVYGSENEIPYSEAQNPLPDNNYGLSKHLSEQVANYYNHNHKMKIKSLRLAQVIGRGERPGYMLDVFRERARDNTPITIWGNGLGQRVYLYLEDAINAIARALDKPEAAGTFNIGMAQSVSHLDLAKTFNTVYASNAMIELERTRPADESKQIMDIAKAEDVLGWRPEYDIKLAIAALKKDYEE